MVQFSAWIFTGAASKAYSDGWPIAVIYIGNAIGFLCNALYFAPKFRQMRVVTFVEAIRNRFGRVNERFFTWIQLPTGIIQAGIWLNALGVFFSAVFGVDLTLTIVGTGAVVLVMSLLSGSWGVLAGDFIQMLILMPVCIVVTVLALLKVGGVGSFFAQLPAHHLDFSQVFTEQFLGLWVVAMLLKQFLSTNNVSDASRYLCVKDSKHARWAGFLGAGLFVVGIVIWFVPPMAAAILHPSLAELYPNMKNPAEASFIAISRDVLPVGMLGLLVSGIFASTIATMDSGLNRNAGIFIKNFYQPVLRPHATDQQLLRASKLTTIVFGGLVIFMAWRLSQLQGLSLFSITVRFSALVTTPFWVPMLLGMLVSDTPPWSAGPRWRSVSARHSSRPTFSRRRRRRSSSTWRRRSRGPPRSIGSRASPPCSISRWAPRGSSARSFSGTGPPPITRSGSSLFLPTCTARSNLPARKEPATTPASRAISAGCVWPTADS
ncbi:MAG: hypothetical protein EXS43_10495 [Opitutus sp.]|nr:hypothetical protein [Opitutus sp.]